VLGDGVRLADAYHATALGALVHNTLPGKLGPFAAAWLLARWSRRPFGAVVSSQLLAKLLELGAIVAVTALGALAVRGSASGLPAIAASGALLLSVMAAIALAAARHAPGLGVRLAHRFPRVGAFVEALGAGLGASSEGRRLLAAAAVGLGPALTSSLAYGLALRSFGVPGGALGGAVVLGVVTFGQFTPGLPVGTGVYWFLCSWAARQLGASAGDAAALAALSHLSTVAAHLTVGSVSALTRRRELRALLRERRAASAQRRAAGAVAEVRRPARGSA
jgi:hypothetical protein